MLRKYLMMLGLLSFGMLGAIESPDLFMQRITQEIIDDLNEQDLERNSSELLEIIDQQILPSVDIGYMARWVIGRTAWNQASKTDQQEFIDQFTQLLTRTYSSTLMMFRDKKIHYLPLTSDYESVKRIQVFCEILQAGKPAINITYQLNRVGDQWKIFDILVEGISMLKGLQAQFSETVSSQGITGATVLIEEKCKGQHHGT